MSRPPTRPVSRRERRAQARYERPATPRRKAPRRSAERPRWQSPVVLTSLGALAIGAVIIAFASGFIGGSGTPGELVTPPTSYAGITTDKESVGSPTAPVVMQVYSDFQCPACKIFVTSELQPLLNEFVLPGLLRIESIDIDIIDRGGSVESQELTAGAFCAAEQNKYWAYHDLVFWNQGRENKGDHSKAFIERVADAALVDRTAFDTCFARTDIRQPVHDRTTAAAAAGISSTPTLVLNGKAVVGVPAYDQLRTVITNLAASATQAPSAVPTTVPTATPAASPTPS
jgi:protein-disulfide isomerase